MADPVSEGAPEPGRYDRPTTRAEHRERLIQAASGDRLWRGMARPWLTWGLLALLVAVHLALGARLYALDKVDVAGLLAAQRPDALLIRAGGQYAPRIAQGELWRLVSCIFLHGDGVHLLFNGVALAGLGRLCEAVYGRGRFLFLFLWAGVCGSTLSYLGGHRLSIGASGAVFGLMGAAIVFGWRHRRELPPGLGDRLRKALQPWVVLNLFIGFLLPFIDNMAHLGGLLGGGAAALVLGNAIVPGREGSTVTRALLPALAIVLMVLAAWGVAAQWR